MTRYWCMRFEAKNSHFKDIIHRIKNFKNVPKSIASHHQSWFCYINATQQHFLQKNFISGPGMWFVCTAKHTCNIIPFNTVKTVTVNQLEYSSQLCTAVPVIKEEMSVKLWVQDFTFTHLQVSKVSRLQIHMYAVALLFSYKHRSSWVKISGTVYKPKNVVALGSYVSGPLFGEIVSILTTDVSECYFVCELFKTISFNTHLHAY